jgi:hypothetical protein
MAKNLACLAQNIAKLKRYIVFLRKKRHFPPKIGKNRRKL